MIVTFYVTLLLIVTITRVTFIDLQLRFVVDVVICCLLRCALLIYVYVDVDCRLRSTHTHVPRTVTIHTPFDVVITFTRLDALWFTHDYTRVCLHAFGLRTLIDCYAHARFGLRTRVCYVCVTRLLVDYAVGRLRLR